LFLERFHSGVCFRAIMSICSILRQFFSNFQESFVNFLYSTTFATPLEDTARQTRAGRLGRTTRLNGSFPQIIFVRDVIDTGHTQILLVIKFGTLFPGIPREFIVTANALQVREQINQNSNQFSQAVFLGGSRLFITEITCQTNTQSKTVAVTNMVGLQAQAVAILNCAVLFNYKVITNARPTQAVNMITAKGFSRTCFGQRVVNSNICLRFHPIINVTLRLMTGQGLPDIFKFGQIREFHEVTTPLRIYFYAIKNIARAFSSFRAGDKIN